MRIERTVENRKEVGSFMDWDIKYESYEDIAFYLARSFMDWDDYDYEHNDNILRVWNVLKDDDDEEDFVTICITIEEEEED